MLKTLLVFVALALTVVACNRDTEQETPPPVLTEEVPPKGDIQPDVTTYVAPEAPADMAVAVITMPPELCTESTCNYEVEYCYLGFCLPLPVADVPDAACPPSTYAECLKRGLGIGYCKHIFTFTVTE